MAKQSYPTLVFWNPEDGGYIAKAPDLPGCSAFGETREEAIAALDDAIDAWIEAQTAAGNLIPAPCQPGVEPAHSGKLLLRMPRQLHAQLANCAKDDSVSLNQFIVYLLADGCARHLAAQVVHPITGTAVATYGSAYGVSSWQGYFGGVAYVFVQVPRYSSSAACSSHSFPIYAGSVAASPGVADLVEASRAEIIDMRDYLPRRSIDHA
jgi:predicted RNase H-like HicB family nuclease